MLIPFLNMYNINFFFFLIFLYKFSKMVFSGYVLHIYYFFEWIYIVKIYIAS